MTVDRTAEQLAREADMVAALTHVAATRPGMRTLVVADDVWEALTGDLPARFNGLPARFAGYDLRQDIAGYGPDLEPGAWRVIDEYGRQLVRSVPTPQTLMRAVDAALLEQQRRYTPNSATSRTLAAARVAAVMQVCEDFGVKL